MRSHSTSRISRQRTRTAGSKARVVQRSCLASYRSRTVPPGKVRFSNSRSEIHDGSIGKNGVPQDCTGGRAPVAPAAAPCNPHSLTFITAHRLRFVRLRGQQTYRVLECRVETGERTRVAWEVRVPTRWDQFGGPSASLPRLEWRSASARRSCPRPRPPRIQRRRRIPPHQPSQVHLRIETYPRLRL